MKDRKNKRRVSMLLNSQTIYHIQKEAEREGITTGEVVDRLVIASRAKRASSVQVRASCRKVKKTLRGNGFPD